MAARLITPMVRSGQLARIALIGPAKAGKTWTALQWAVVLEELEVLYGNKGGILGIDTERGEMALYADKFLQADGEVISHMRWDPPYDPRELREVIKANSENYAVIVIDSGSHFWRGEGGVLDIVDEAASSGYGGNKFAGWKEGTPAQNELIEAITSAKCHVIFTMRATMKYILETNDKGKQQPKRVGLAPVQRDDMEYEFTIITTVDMDHNIEVIGTRCDLLDRRRFKMADTPQLAEILGEWLQGAEPLISRPELEQISAAVKAVDRRWVDQCRSEFREKFGPSDRLRSSQVDEALAFITGWQPDTGGVEGTEEEIAAEAVAKAKTSAPRGATKKKPGARQSGAKKAPTSKKTGAKKPTKKPAKKTAAKRSRSTAPRDRPIPDEGEPWDETPADTPEPATAAPEGNEAEEIRTQIANIHLQMSGAFAAEMEAQLEEAGLWPINEIADDLVNEAVDIVAPIAEEAAEASNQ